MLRSVRFMRRPSPRKWSQIAVSIFLLYSQRFLPPIDCTRAIICSRASSMLVGPTAFKRVHSSSVKMPSRACAHFCSSRRLCPRDRAKACTSDRRSELSQPSAVESTSSHNSSCSACFMGSPSESSVHNAAACSPDFATRSAAQQPLERNSEAARNFNRNCFTPTDMVRVEARPPPGAHEPCLSAHTRI